MWNKKFDGTKYSRKDNFLRLIDKLCDSLEIRHQLIRTRTHRHDEKVERNYRNYNERFYRHLSFYSYENLTYQMNRFFYKSNRLSM